MSLNMEPLPKARSVWELAILMYGLEGVGKTSFAAEFPDVYLLSLESGHKGLEREVHGCVPTSWAQLKEAVDQLVAEDRFKFVVVDTVDIAYDLCLDHVCAVAGIDHPSDEEYSKGWSRVKREFRRLIVKLQASKGVLFLSHAKQVEIETAAGAKRQRTVPTYTGQCGGIIEPAVDLWMFYEYTVDGGRRIVMQGNADVAAKNRCASLFKEKFEIDAGRSAEDAFGNFKRSFASQEGPGAVKRVRRKRKKT